jgi:hypothetical protein
MEFCGRFLNVLVLKEAEKSIPTKKKIKIKINGNST